MYRVTNQEHTPPLRATSTPVLQLEGLQVPFAQRTASAKHSVSRSDGLHDISLSISAGERLVLLGPSGEGKTTLLRAVAGLSPIAGGTVRVNGRDVSSLDPELRSTVYLHQVPVLFPHLSVLDNVAFPLAVRGVARAERLRTAQLLLDRLRLDGLGNRLPHMLSGGQRHRVALARALSAQPHMLLLDEPLSALDPALRRDVREAIRDAHDSSDAGLMLVTHDLDDATTLGDRIAVLLDRSIAQVATAEELFARPASLAVMRFLGVHQELSGTMHSAHSVRTGLGVLPLPADVASGLTGAQALTVGIRTDAIQCIAQDQRYRDPRVRSTTDSSSDAGPGGPTDQASAAFTIITSVQVEQLHTRASGSTATVRAGDLTVQASINALHTPQVGDHAALHIDTRGIVAFAN